jgi:hypothetical protein
MYLTISKGNQIFTLYETGDRKTREERRHKGKIPYVINPNDDTVISDILGRKLLCAGQQFSLIF